MSWVSTFLVKFGGKKVLVVESERADGKKERRLGSLISELASGDVDTHGQKPKKAHALSSTRERQVEQRS